MFLIDPLARWFTATLLAANQQKRLMVLATAFAQTDDLLREDLVHHQRMEHNYDHAVGLLEELESDLESLKKIRSHLKDMHKVLQFIRTHDDT